MSGSEKFGKVCLMNPQILIRKKRDGAEFSVAEIQAFVNGVSGGAWADYQISALLMAMFIRGLNLAEQNALTKAMLESGEILDFSEIDAPKADKHSTGGVGDKTSLIIAPLAAACGVAVPMISGRGLGHTGGTLDKLESISGYNVRLSKAEFKRIIKKCGFALAGQTDKIVPADKKIYALRDATATVESIPLIVASIMSKKMAEGLDALVLDVKTGSGAFMEKREDAVKLARALVETGKSFNVKTSALITGMNQPLGKFVGNATEVYECVKILRGETDELMQPTLELSIALTAEMLVLCGIGETIQDSRLKIQNALNSGAALEKFRQNIELQKGDAKICDTPEILLEKNTLQIPVTANADGFIAEIDTKTIGESIASIGGGRLKVEDEIDYAVGYESRVKIGDEIVKDEPFGILYCRSENQAHKISENLRSAYKISVEKPQTLKLVKEIID